MPPRNSKAARISRPKTGPRPSRPAPKASADAKPASRNTTRVAKPRKYAQANDAAPQKLHKMLAQAGLGSRRDMEKMIAEGRVTVNSQVAEVGSRVGPDDRVFVDKRQVRLNFDTHQVRILIYHKQEGEIVSQDDPEKRATVFAKLPRIQGGKWMSVGRLDFNTSGLLIFTSSGELANQLMHPRFEVEREYAVRVMGELTQEQIAQLKEGIELEDGFAKFEGLIDQGGEGANHWYHVVLREGRNREVRRMFEALGLMVSRLIRVRFGIINLPARLKRGQLLELEPKQVEQVLTWVGPAPVHSATFIPVIEPED